MKQLRDAVEKWNSINDYRQLTDEESMEIIEALIPLAERHLAVEGEGWLPEKEKYEKDCGCNLKYDNCECTSRINNRYRRIRNNIINEMALRMVKNGVTEEEIFDILRRQDWFCKNRKTTHEDMMQTARAILTLLKKERGK